MCSSKEPRRWNEAKQEKTKELGGDLKEIKDLSQKQIVMDAENFSFETLCIVPVRNLSGKLECYISLHVTSFICQQSIIKSIKSSRCYLLSFNIFRISIDSALTSPVAFPQKPTIDVSQKKQEKKNYCNFIQLYQATSLNHRKSEVAFLQLSPWKARCIVLS